MNWSSSQFGTEGESLLPLGKKRLILHAIVQTYLETGEPVSSSQVAQRWPNGSAPSSATIRNAMADMVRLGLLTQPHASAGRLPTAAAIQSYVDGLGQVRPKGIEVNRLHARLRSLPSVPERVEESTHFLTGATRNVGIAAAVPASEPVLRQVELLPLAERQYLMVVVTSDQHVRNQVVTTSQSLRPEELQEIRNYINLEFGGWKLNAARRELEQRLQDERNEYFRLLRQLEVFHMQGLFAHMEGPRVFLDGAAYLVGLDLHLTRERMRELFQALEQKQQLLAMLDQFLEGTAARPAVRVGLGSVHPALSEFALIGVAVPVGSGMTARVAVLGPLRLNYPRSIAAVMEAGQALADSAS
jgi:heat-inducible transcriptional repressor